MGGYGSGNRLHTTTKIEDCRCLDIKRLIEIRAILRDGKTSGNISWSDKETGEYLASISYTSNTLDEHNQHINLRYSFTETGKAMDYNIQISRTTPHFGGARYWFVCPVKYRRVAKLYLPYGGDMFASRHAYRLKYGSQSEAPLDRALRKKWKMLEKFNDRLDLPERPKGMQMKTYDKLLEQYEQQSLICDTHLLNACRHFGFDINGLKGIQS